jgi:small subunit ribosomal protein S10
MSTDKKRTIAKPSKSTASLTKKRPALGGSMVKMRLKAYYPDRLDYSVREIVETVKRTGAVVSGPIPLPRRIRRWTLLTSPHVDKDAREQLQLTQHGRVLIIHVSSADTMNAIRQIELPPEVDVVIQVVDSLK